MSVALFAVVVDCEDPNRLAAFWAYALGHEVHERNPGEYQVGTAEDESTPLYFMKVPEAKVVKNRVHWDLVTAGSIEAEVARLVAAGAEEVEIHQDPPSFENPDTWTIMRDPEGNEFCVTSTATLTGWS
jgi:predicted enzyme related to lactoylglutathione lyase